MIEVSEVQDSQTWDATLLNLPANHVLQSWSWGEFKAAYGWTATRLLFTEEGRVRAAAQVLRRRMLHLPLAVMYVPKGPAMDYANLPLLETVLAHLEAVARRGQAIFIKIDPDVCLKDDDESHPVVAVLRRRGWRHSAEQIQFPNTVLVDLVPDEEAILAAMKSKTRYNIRLAARHGVTVRLGTVDDLPLFYQLYNETSQRDGFLIRPYAYYQDAWGRFLEAGRAQLFLAEHEGDTLAGLILFIFGQTAWYMYGASSAQKRELMPNHLLQWEAMRWARAQGCTVYDMWGAPDVLDESDPLWGVYRFKAGFGGQFTRRIGAYDYPTRGPLYRAYTLLMPRYLNFLRRRHQVR
ncbi:MAG: peptidoglycan bridge formation glycyltransferase FemA/FemB family protein [Anaerolineae bacterium]|jgi:lipid II:glycine glycyltransferase (peptidoglycan interpeptide bridge formation enzyme)|nr:peptidoglycan bridge formation glycyltransferase FemA/FemB family protein [Anaerolineae bacterium]MDH7472404.1 peptidoglycan bridge formation glycyltransferase FemA/FemB family protein [Anaerolineae bacterium]